MCKLIKFCIYYTLSLYSMKTNFKTCDINIIPPKKKAFQIDTAPDFFQLHTLCIASGTRGQGKTTAVINLVRSEERRVGKECRSRWSPYH